MLLLFVVHKSIQFVTIYHHFDIRKSDVFILLYHQVLLACLEDLAARQHSHPKKRGIIINFIFIELNLLYNKLNHY